MTLACASISNCDSPAEVKATYQRLDARCSKTCWPDSKPFCRPCGERVEGSWQSPHDYGDCPEGHPIEFLRLEGL